MRAGHSRHPPVRGEREADRQPAAGRQRHAPAAEQPVHQAHVDGADDARVDVAVQLAPRCVGTGEQGGRDEGEGRDRRQGDVLAAGRARNELEPGSVLSQVQLAGQERLRERRPHVAVHRGPGDPVDDEGHGAQQDCLNEGRSAIEVQAVVGHSGALSYRGEGRRAGRRWTRDDNLQLPIEGRTCGVAAPGRLTCGRYRRGEPPRNATQRQVLHSSGCRPGAEGAAGAEAGRGWCADPPERVLAEQRRCLEGRAGVSGSSTPEYRATSWPASRRTCPIRVRPLWQASRRILIGITCSGTRGSARRLVTARHAARLRSGICCRTRAGRPTWPRHCRRRSPSSIPMDLFGLITGLPAETAQIPWDGPEVRIMEHQAHASGHAALLVREPGVLVAGDMLSDGLIPMLDLNGTADPIEAYLAALRLLGGAASDVSVPSPATGRSAELISPRTDRSGSGVRARLARRRCCQRSQDRLIGQGWLGVGGRRARRATHRASPNESSATGTPG